VSSAKDTAAIVTFLARNKEPQKLTEISRKLHISGSTAYRILSALREIEWVSQDPETKRYKAGVGLLEISLTLISQLDLRSAAAPFLEILSGKVREGVTLSARVGLERIYVSHIQSDHELQHVVSWGKRLPLWVGAPGKAILAYISETERDAVLSGLNRSGPPSFASGRRIDEEDLRQELSEVRSKGFAVSRAERVAGTISVAAPIFDQEGRVVGAVSVGAPELRLSLDTARGYGPLVRETAEKISSRLGRQPDRREVQGRSDRAQGEEKTKSTI